MARFPFIFEARPSSGAKGGFLGIRTCRDPFVSKIRSKHAASQEVSTLVLPLFWHYELAAPSTTAF